MNIWKVILATVVIFAAGAITGGLIVRNSQAKASLQAKSENGHASAPQGTNSVRDHKLPAPPIWPLTKNFVDKLQRELNMDADQRERVSQIICDGQEITRLIWQEIEPDIYHTIVETKDKIRAELTPEQLAKFEELLKPKPKSAPATNTVPAAVTDSAPLKP